MMMVDFAKASRLWILNWTYLSLCRFPNLGHRSRNLECRKGLANEYYSVRLISAVLPLFAFLCFPVCSDYVSNTSVMKW